MTIIVHGHKTYVQKITLTKKQAELFASALFVGLEGNLEISSKNYYHINGIGNAVQIAAGIK